jgi:hypothetical protein
MRKLLHRVSLVVAALIIAAPGAFAQGCAMCYQNAANSGPQGAAALRHGIIVLMIPPLTIFSGILGMLYQRRNSSRAGEELPSTEA